MCLKQTFLARTKLGECKKGLWVIPPECPPWLRAWDNRETKIEEQI